MVWGQHHHFREYFSLSYHVLQVLFFFMTFALFQHLHASYQDYYYGIISQPCLVPRGPLPIIDVGSLLQIPSSSSPLSSHCIPISSSPTMDSIQDCNTQLSIGLTGHNSRPLRFSDQLPFAPKPLDSAASTFSHRNVVAMGELCKRI